MEDAVEGGVEDVARGLDGPPDEFGSGGDALGGPGGAVVEDDDLVALFEQHRGDDRADVSGAAGDEIFHSASLRIWAAFSGPRSLTKPPMTDSEEARNLTLPAARRVETISSRSHARSRCSFTGAWCQPDM